MKILVLNYEYPPIGGGGGYVCKMIAEELAETGHEVRVQTSWFPGLPKRETKGNLEIFRTFSFRRKKDTCRVWEMGLFLVTNFWPSFRHIKKWNPDLIHVHFAVPTGVLAYVLHFFLKTPYVLTIHLGDVPGALPDQTGWLFKFLNPFIRPIWKNAAKIVAVSEFVRNLGIKAYGMPVDKILNGIQPPKTEFVPKASSPIRFLFAGRFNPQKNLHFLLEVMQEIDERNWILVLAGDGPLRPSLEANVEKMGLQDHIQFTGWLSDKDLRQQMNEAHAFVLPSEAEGLPMVGIQALFWGLPILGSQVGGLVDLVDDGKNGYLIPVNNRNAWVEKFRRILNHPDELASMGQISVVKSKQFEIEKIAKQYGELFQEVSPRDRQGQ